jgi:site-specific DNA recombinase
MRTVVKPAVGDFARATGQGVSIKLLIAGTEESRAQLSDAVAITRSFPMQLKRRGVELRLVLGDHDRSGAAVDLPLLKTVARAHSWFDVISTGKANSLAEIAVHEGLAVRYVGRVIPLAFLAPDIVESIVEGRQPTSLTAEVLTRHIELPLEWRSQKAVMNIQ